MVYENRRISGDPWIKIKHTIQAIVILTIIGNKHPNLYQSCKRLWEDVALSRIALGVHYPSDNDFSIEVANKILKHDKFAEKYSI